MGNPVDAKRVKRLTAELAALTAAGEPLAALDSARKVREAAEELELELVRAARAAGASWTKIGARYGMTKQGAQQRFRERAARQEPVAAVSDEPDS